MCQTCFERGYNDYPKWVGSAPHPGDYKKGFDTHQAEVGEAGHYAEAVDFCETCYNRGYADGLRDYWAPPTTPKYGHKESYEKGFNKVNTEQVEKERREEEYQQQQKEQKEAAYQQKLSQGVQQASRLTTTNTDEYVKNLLLKLLGYLIALVAIVWFVGMVVSIVLTLALINIAAIALIAGMIKKNWSKYLFPLSILTSIYFIWDYNNGWTNRNIVNSSSSFLSGLLTVFFYTNIIAGLVSAYFLIRNYLNGKTPPVGNEGEFSKRNLIVMGSLVLLGGLTIGGQKYFDAHKPVPMEIPLQSAVTGTSAFVQTKHDSTLRLRAAPSEQAAIVSNIPNGSALTILRYADQFTMLNGEKGKWCQVNFNGTVGWAWGGFLKVGEKDGQATMDNGQKLAQTEVKKLIGKQMVEDRIIEQSCLSYLDSFVEIKVIKLNQAGLQYLVYTSAGLCGEIYNTPCLYNWVYEYKNNNFRLLGPLDCIRGGVSVLKTRTNGYLDIETVNYVGAYGDKFVFRFKYNGKEYKHIR